MAKSKKEREDGVTYYDMLKWVDLQIEVRPLSLGELGLLFYILQTCNKNFSVDCELNLRVVSAKTSAEVRRLPNKLKELEGKGYIKAEEISPNIWSVHVNYPAEDKVAEVRRMPGKRLDFANGEQGVEPIVETPSDNFQTLSDNFQTFSDNFQNSMDKVAKVRRTPGKSSAEVRRMPGKRLDFANGEQGVKPIVATRQDKTRQDNFIIKKNFKNFGTVDVNDDDVDVNWGGATNYHPTPDQPPPTERRYYGDVELSETAKKFGFGG